MKKLLTLLLLGSTLLISSSMTGVESKPINSIEDFDINNYAWLADHWTGGGFGGISDEVWSLPADGVMMGTYRNIQEGKVIFYEFITLDKTGMKLKHFNPDMEA